LLGNRTKNRTTQRYKVKKLPDEGGLTRRIIDLVAQYVRNGTPRITAMLNREGFKVNHKRVERLLREQGIKFAKKTEEKTKAVIKRRFIY